MIPPFSLMAAFSVCFSLSTWSNYILHDISNLTLTHQWRNHSVFHQCSDGTCDASILVAAINEDQGTQLEWKTGEKTRKFASVSFTRNGLAVIS